MIYFEQHCVSTLQQKWQQSKAGLNVQVDTSPPSFTCITCGRSLSSRIGHECAILMCCHQREIQPIRINWHKWISRDSSHSTHTRSVKVMLYWIFRQWISRWSTLVLWRCSAWQVRHVVETVVRCTESRWLRWWWLLSHSNSRFTITLCWDTTTLHLSCAANKYSHYTRYVSLQKTVTFIQQINCFRSLTVTYLSTHLSWQTDILDFT